MAKNGSKMTKKHDKKLSFREKTKMGGSEGGLAKDHTFFGFFFRHTPLIMIETKTDYRNGLGRAPTYNRKILRRVSTHLYNLSICHTTCNLSTVLIHLWWSCFVWRDGSSRTGKSRTGFSLMGFAKNLSLRVTWESQWKHLHSSYEWNTSWRSMQKLTGKNTTAFSSALLWFANLEKADGGKLSPRLREDIKTKKNVSIRALPDFFYFEGGGVTLARFFLTLFLTNK